MLKNIAMPVWIVCLGLTCAQAQEFSLPQAASQHEFLKRFVGEWETVSEMFPGDGTTVTADGKLHGRMIGDFWVVLEVSGDMMGQPFTGLSTLGYDSAKSKKYIGTWTDSMSDFMWHYQGSVEGNKLVLNSEGPDPMQTGKMLKAVDAWEFVGDDKVILTGQMELTEGEMTTMVKVTGTRKK